MVEGRLGPSRKPYKRTRWRGSETPVTNHELRCIATGQVEKVYMGFIRFYEGPQVITLAALDRPNRPGVCTKNQNPILQMTLMLLQGHDIGRWARQSEEV